MKWDNELQSRAQSIANYYAKTVCTGTTHNHCSHKVLQKVLPRICRYIMHHVPGPRPSRPSRPASTFPTSSMSFTSLTLGTSPNNSAPRPTSPTSSTSAKGLYLCWEGERPVYQKCVGRTILAQAVCAQAVCALCRIWVTRRKLRHRARWSLQEK